MFSQHDGGNVRGKANIAILIWKAAGAWCEYNSYLTVTLDYRHLSPLSSLLCRYQFLTALTTYIKSNDELPQLRS